MMTKDRSLYLYEEVMLLALRDEDGTIATGFAEKVIVGAILADLLLDSRISVDDSRKNLVNVQNKRSTGDSILDECLEKMAASKHQESLQTWVSRLASTKKLRHKVALQLCQQGILRVEEDKVLFIFKRRIYPVIDSGPKRMIVERLRSAIFTELDVLDPRTIVLISLANGADLLNHTFGRKEIKAQKQRIEQIVKGELTGKATKDVISACQTAAMIAVIMPVIMTTTINN